MSKSVTAIIVDDGLEEVIHLDPENDPEFEDTLGNLLCEIFEAPAVKYHIEVMDYETKDTFTN